MEHQIRALVSMVRGFLGLAYEIRECNAPRMAREFLNSEEPVYGLFTQESPESMEGLIFQFTYRGEVRWKFLPDGRSDHSSEGWEFASVLQAVVLRHQTWRRRPAARERRSLVRATPSAKRVPVTRHQDIYDLV